MVEHAILENRGILFAALALAVVEEGRACVIMEVVVVVVILGL